MSKHFTFNRIFGFSLLTTALISYSAYASYYQQFYQDARGLGTTNVGAAADAQDAAIQYANPAGLAKLKRQQIIAGGIFGIANAEFNGRHRFIDNGNFTSNTFSYDLVSPATTSLSLSYAISQQLTLMASADYSYWKTLKQYVFRNLITPMGQVLTNIQPDNDSKQVSLGVHYQVSKLVGLDAGYTHIFIKQTDINYNTPPNAQIGTAGVRGDLLGLQAIWTI